MKTRCLNKNNKAYYRYGGRGIKICKRWVSSFDNFLEDMGEPGPGMSLDRINVNGGYTPRNCRWATRAEQAANTRRSKLYPELVKKIRSGIISVGEVVALTGCSKSTFYAAKNGANWGYIK